MGDLGGLDLDMLQALFPALAQPATVQPNIANRPLPPREKSGKLPGKNQPRNNNSEKIQEYRLYEKIATENRPVPSREKGGKSAGKTPVKHNNCKDNQIDTLWQKISGLMPAPLLSKHAPRVAGNSKFETLLQQCENTGKVPTDIPLSEYIYEQSLRDNQQKTL
jgi:hypothetical protein